MRWVSSGFSIRLVGAISVTVPSETLLPSPVSTWPRSPRGSIAPNWNRARRSIALPAITFSPTAAAMKPAGAQIVTLPAATSSALTTPRTPPK